MATVEPQSIVVESQKAFKEKVICSYMIEFPPYAVDGDILSVELKRLNTVKFNWGAGMGLPDAVSDTPFEKRAGETVTAIHP